MFILELVQLSIWSWSLEKFKDYNSIIIVGVWQDFRLTLLDTFLESFHGLGLFDESLSVGSNDNKKWDGFPICLDSTDVPQMAD